MPVYNHLIITVRGVGTKDKPKSGPSAVRWKFSLDLYMYF